MKEILLTSSALILALLALRQLFRRTVSRRMQYALWLLVLVRLLVPVNVGTLAHNVLSAAAPVQAVVEERLDTPVLYVQDGTERRRNDCDNRSGIAREACPANICTHLRARPSAGVRCTTVHREIAGCRNGRGIVTIAETHVRTAGERGLCKLEMDTVFPF